MLEEQLIDAWRIHNRIQLHVLESLPEETLPDASLGRGRTVGDHFAHVHNVRLMWLKSAAPALLEGLDKVEKEGALVKQTLMNALETSGEAMATLLKESIAAGGKVKGFKPNVAGFFGYLISHESYHMGKIDLILRQAGHPMDDKIHYGMWEWGSSH
jgi:uncharacterized damage-inducible protein DinB